MKNEITITREQFFDFVKKEDDTVDNVSKSTQHYLDCFDKYKETGKKVSWNWSAFFFLYLWFLYRKMYLYGFLVLLGCFAFRYPIGFLKTNPYNMHAIVVVLFVLGCGIAFRLYLNYIYLCYANKKITTGMLNSGTNSRIVWIILTAELAYEIWLRFY